jgi:hypothetical protein
VRSSQDDVLPGLWGRRPRRKPVLSEVRSVLRVGFVRSDTNVVSGSGASAR